MGGKVPHWGAKSPPHEFRGDRKKDIGVDLLSALCFPYLSITIIGRKLPSEFSVGPRLTTVLSARVNGCGYPRLVLRERQNFVNALASHTRVGGLSIRYQIFPVGDGLRTRVGVGARLHKKCDLQLTVGASVRDEGF